MKLFLTIFLSLVSLFVVFFMVSMDDISRRNLSLSTDHHTGENVRTINGTIPEVSCQLGYFRPSGSTVLRRVSGPRQDGCRPCPRGRYGDRMGLKHSTCSGLCPVGTYGDKEGLTSILECKACPTGTFGARSGLTSSLCSGKCPKGYYTDLERSTSCKKCPLHYTGSQCVDI